ncbi:MAG: 4'-phosphopantetheinyl transferase superfamily protein [Acidobacteriales bacterium]|nr:4'-phosphopantetheinyl transferase superfamily protein [Terriglobales bacterium]
MVRIDKRDGAKLLSDQCDGIPQRRPDHSNGARYPIINKLIEHALAARLTSTPLCADAWMLSRQSLASCHAGLSTLLNSEERGRADSFFVEQDRRGFIVARALLRILIAAYCSCDPKEVEFQYGPYGKPKLVTPSYRSQDFGFNLSHSADSVVIALVTDAEIGVDIEELSAGSSQSEVIADSCLNGEEVLRIKYLPVSTRARTLLRYWTHKEASLKAIGCGLSMSPQNLTIMFKDSDRSVILRADPTGRQTLFGYDLPCGEDYVGAIVSPYPLPQPRFFRL